MKPALIDTDTVSYYFRGDANVTENLNAYLAEQETAYLSVITYYEILNGLYFKDAKKQLASFERFVELNEIVPMTDSIAKRSARIHANLRTIGKTIGNNDILIAGTALINDFTLITNNTRHFSEIAGLDLENWMVT